MAKTLTITVPDGYNVDQIEKALRSGFRKRSLTRVQDTRRIAMAREGKYVMRLPIGYDRNDNGTLSINTWQAQHVMSIFSLVLQSRIDPDNVLGKYSYADIHHEYLSRTGGNVSRADPAFVRAVVNRRTYIGEIWYRGNHLGTCPRIIPAILFNLMHESTMIVQASHQRPHEWKEKKRTLIHESYGMFLKRADEALSLLNAGDTDLIVMAALGFDLDELAETLFTFKQRGRRKRKLFKCLTQ